MPILARQSRPARGRILAEHRHRAAVPVAVTLEDLDRGGLASPVRAQQREHLAAADVQVDAVDSDRRAVALAEPAHAIAVSLLMAPRVPARTADPAPVERLHLLSTVRWTPGELSGGRQSYQACYWLTGPERISYVLKDPSWLRRDLTRAHMHGPNPDRDEPVVPPHGFLPVVGPEMPLTRVDLHLPQPVWAEAAGQSLCPRQAAALESKEPGDLAVIEGSGPT